MRLKKVFEIINVTIDEIGRQKLKEEENKSMEQLYKEETKYEKEVEEEDEYEGNLTEEKDKVQQVSPKTPRK